MNIQRLTLTTLFAFVLASVSLALPYITSADTNASRLGGGNAVLRAQTGMTNANPMSDIFARLQFASLHGGQEEDVPEGEEVGDEQSETETNANANTNANSNQNAVGGNGNNGGALGANGGAGGDGGPSGLIRAGDVVSNATAQNSINVVIIRIGR